MLPWEKWNFQNYRNVILGTLAQLLNCYLCCHHNVHIQNINRNKQSLKKASFKVSVNENEVLTENSSRASIFATKASYISN